MTNYWISAVTQEQINEGFIYEANNLRGAKETILESPEIIEKINKDGEIMGGFKKHLKNGQVKSRWGVFKIDDGKVIFKEIGNNDDY
jgi:hypothetical protein